MSENGRAFAQGEEGIFEQSGQSPNRYASASTNPEVKVLEGVPVQDNLEKAW